MSWSSTNRRTAAWPALGEPRRSEQPPRIEANARGSQDEPAPLRRLQAQARHARFARKSEALVDSLSASHCRSSLPPRRRCDCRRRGRPSVPAVYATMKVGKDDYDPFSVYELAETGMFTLGGPRRPCIGAELLLAYWDFGDALEPCQSVEQAMPQRVRGGRASRCSGRP